MFVRMNFVKRCVYVSMSVGEVFFFFLFEFYKIQREAMGGSTL